ncbi:hypothetical protein KYK29_05130 [Shinella daejeonensis]|uniref:hypothetical protein n=1 Tax=Shinella daejeonensis TaxID=659017 RepID=UPI0020C829CD|nr:hypothetical protein [Shinella daejeonensis]MCP8894304.1 hypothetical protein [Shinella daejeonensis]
MRTISSANNAALAARLLLPRDFLWIVARDRDDNGPQAVGFWSDVGNVSADVLDPDTGAIVTRTWYGSGTLIGIDAIPLVANLAVQTVTIAMNQIDDLVQQAVRLYDCKQARVEIYRGLLNPLNRQMVAPAFCRFVGFVDEVDITTPAENQTGSVTLKCVSHTQEMTRSNPDTRSDVSQRNRVAGDRFYADVSTVGDQEFFWGRARGKIDGKKAKA